MLGAALCAAAPVSAHNVMPQSVRELVRLQGYRSSKPDGLQVQRQLTLSVLGEDQPFFAAEWRVFGFNERGAGAAPAEPDRYTLQGERAVLARFAAARPEQRITVLAERRPGATDLFILTLDLCPSE